MLNSIVAFNTFMAWCATISFYYAQQGARLHFCRSKPTFFFPRKEINIFADEARLLRWRLQSPETARQPLPPPATAEISRQCPAREAVEPTARTNRLDMFTRGLTTTAPTHTAAGGGRRW